MRIAYLARWDVSHESGILKKMASQMRVWLARGHEVRLFALSPGSHLWEGMAELPITAFHGDDLWTRLSRRRSISRPILEWNPDVVYYRFSTFYPALERVMEEAPTVLEINSDDLAEYPLVYPRPLYWAHRLTRERVFGRAAGVVYVTHELSRKPENLEHGKPSLVLGNGIDMAAHELIAARSNDAPRLVFIGTPGCPWHGLDKLVTLARAFPDWQVDVIGYLTDDTSSSSPPNIRFHGQLGRESYQTVVAHADVAVGTLALHRNQMNEASTLKTREYLAYGLPTIIAYNDTDFPEGHPLLLQLPNTPANVETHLDEIRHFVERARGARIPRADVAHLDVEAKEDVRLDFLARVAHQAWPQ